MKLGLRGLDVAKMVGVTTDTITNWELNRNIPEARYMNNIISFLGYAPFETKGETLKDRIPTYRKLNGFTQFQIAELAGVDPSTLASIEKGEREVSNKTFLKISTKMKGLLTWVIIVSFPP